MTTYPDSAQVSLVLALASAGGGGGAATGNTAGTGTAGGAAPSLSNNQLSAFAIAANVSTAGSSGTAGGAGTTPSAGTNVQYLAASTSVPFTGGAGGGGSSSLNAVANGGAVNAVSTSNIFWSNSTTIIPGGAGVAGSTINGNSGWSNINPLDHTNSITMPYYSLGGSGAPGAATVVGGVGGSGGIGSGGGGGGSGTTGGAGGNGGAGAVIITWW